MEIESNKYAGWYYSLIFVVVCYFLILPLSASAADRPSYQLLRFNEDWSTTAELPEKDAFDRIKYIPLSGDKSVWFSLGGHVRERAEVWQDFNFGTPAENDDVFLLHRFLLHGDLHIGKHVRVFGEFVNAIITERDLPGGRRTMDVDTADLLNAFVDLNIPLKKMDLTLRVGRQELNFGKNRLVSPLPWANSYRHWDGFSLLASYKDWKAHGFATRFVPVDKYDFNEVDTDHDFYGLYLTYKKNLDLYYFGRRKEQRGKPGNERHTLGFRYGEKIGDTGFDYDFEAAYQFGTVGSNDVSAFMLGSRLGYTFANVDWKPQTWLSVELGSGDNNPADNSVGTFDQLFPLGHAYLGYIDIVGRQNIVDFNQGIGIKPMPKLGVKLGNHVFWRADNDDALYNAGGGVARASGSSNEKFVGVETDLTINYKFNSHLSGLLGYSHFFAGEFIEDTGKSKDIDFIYLQLKFTF